MCTAADSLAARSTARTVTSFLQLGEPFDAAGRVAVVHVVAAGDPREIAFDQVIGDPPGVVRRNGLRQSLSAHPVDAHGGAGLVRAEVVSAQNALVGQIPVDASAGLAGAPARP